MNVTRGLFIKDLVFLLNMLTLVQHMQGKRLYVHKCCPKGLQLDADLKSCTAVPGQNVSSEREEVLHPPIDLVINYWVHPLLQSLSLVVSYWDSVSGFKLDVTTIKEFTNPEITGSELREFEGEINPLLVLHKRSCYDRIPSNKSTYILMETTILRRIFKCCSKGERLDMTSNECQQHQDLPFDPLKQEVVGVPRGKDYSWLPKNLSEYVLKIQYSALQPEEDYNVRIVADEAFSWRILVSQEEDRETIIWFRDRNVTGVTDVFCFEETTDDRGVLLAALYDVHKCCGRDEYVNDVRRVCVPRERRDGRTDEGENNRRNSADAYWLPEALSDTRLHVRYDSIFPMSAYRIGKGYITNESLWRVEKATNVSLSTLIVNFTQLSGNVQIFNTTRFCFDFVRESTKVVIVHIPRQEDYMRKCCLPGEIFSTRGVCEKHKGQDWTPRTSKMNTLFKQSIYQENIVFPLKYYCTWRFDVLPRDSPRALEHYEGKHTEWQSRVFMQFCNEWQRTTDGGVDEVVGRCESPEHARIFEKFLYVVMASTVLFASAAAAACANGEMRRSGHGFSLACHALCLGTQDALQLADIYQWPQCGHDCFPYVYLTFFFMVAANWWLTAITFNIYYNFRQPLGAMAAAGAAASGTAVCKRFAVLSAFAWGGSVVVVACTTALHHVRVAVLKSRFAPPPPPQSFFSKTRASDDFEDKYYIDGGRSGSVPVGSPEGTVLYYLVPMALLSIANLVCVLLTARRVSHLRRGNSILKRAAASRPATASQSDDVPTACLPPQHMQMVLLYAKLLLTSGIVELSLEAAVWMFGVQTDFMYASRGKVLLTGTSHQLLYLSVFIVVDFARALLVFWMAVGRDKGAARAVTWARDVWETTWPRMKCRGCCSARRGGRVGVQQPQEAPNVAMAELQAKDGKAG